MQPGRTKLECRLVGECALASGLVRMGRSVAGQQGRGHQRVRQLGRLHLLLQQLLRRQHAVCLRGREEKVK